jgi:hypothetical protein
MGTGYWGSFSGRGSTLKEKDVVMTGAVKKDLSTNTVAVASALGLELRLLPRLDAIG